MAHRIIEMLIGRLITDEEFRSKFLENPEKTLTDLNDQGLELSRTEVAALVSTAACSAGHARHPLFRRAHSGRDHPAPVRRLLD